MRIRVFAACLAALAIPPSLALAGGTVTPTGSRNAPTVSVRMLGKNEVPKGAPHGSGHAAITLDSVEGKVCWKFSAVEGIDKVTASGIQLGTRGKAGIVVVPFFIGTLKTGGCVSVGKSVVAQILKHPAGFYVNIRTVKHPAGAIRGQL